MNLILMTRAKERGVKIKNADCRLQLQEPERGKCVKWIELKETILITAQPPNELICGRKRRLCRSEMKIRFSLTMHQSRP